MHEENLSVDELLRLIAIEENELEEMNKVVNSARPFIFFGQHGQKFINRKRISEHKIYIFELKRQYYERTGTKLQPGK